MVNRGLDPGVAEGLERSRWICEMTSEVDSTLDDTLAVGSKGKEGLRMTHRFLAVAAEWIAVTFTAPRRPRRPWEEQAGRKKRDACETSRWNCEALN